MKTRYKFIHFEVRADDEDIWECHNNRSDNLLGELNFEKQWKQWVFAPEHSCIFRMDCLGDIISFTKQLPTKSRGRNEFAPTGIAVAPRGVYQEPWEEKRYLKFGMGRTVDGFASRVDELRLLGNGVVPAQAELAFRTLAGLTPNT